jgi:hypothetical protein
MLSRTLSLFLSLVAVIGASLASPIADRETREPNFKRTKVTCNTLYKGVLSTAQFYNIDVGGNCEDLTSQLHVFFLRQMATQYSL